MGDGLGRGVTVGVGLATSVRGVVDEAAFVGTGAFEQASNASKPVRISANARNFPGINLRPRPY